MKNISTSPVCSATLSALFVLAGFSCTQKLSPEPPPNGMALAAPIIINDVRVMLTAGCNCTGAWSQPLALAAEPVNVALPSFNFPLAGRPRVIFQCEVSAAGGVSTFMLAFDKACNKIKQGCRQKPNDMTIAVAPPAAKNSVVVSKGNTSVTVKPSYNGQNTGGLQLTTANCGAGCQFRWRQCSGNWTFKTCQ